MKVVIIGGGTAGVTAATHLRRNDENAEIIILEKSDEFAVAACGLPYLISGEIKDKDELIGATSEQMKQIFKIEVRLNHEVVNIDRNKKELTIENQPAESYDILILATGALQLRPDIDGILGDNIFTLRNLNAAERIIDYYEGTEAHKVVILGGGNIGVEMAESLKKRGAEVYLVEAAPHILANFDEDMAAVLQNKLRDNGIHLYLNSMIQEFRETEIVLKDGRRFDYDMAIVAAGVKPDIKLPVMADIEIGASGGIIVNEMMQTNDENIYACGDNVEVTNLITNQKERTPTSSTAVKQARVAAENIAGIKSLFPKSAGNYIIKIFNDMAGAAGCNERKLQENQISYHKVHLFQDDHAGYLPDPKRMLFKLLFGEDGKILGVQGIGEKGIDTRVDTIAAYIRKGGTYNDLTDAEMAYAPSYGSAKDAVNKLGSLAEGILRDKVRYVYYEDLPWDKVGSDIMLIDTRSPESFKAGHIAHAVNFPLASLRENLSSIPRDKQVVLYCYYGYGAYNAYCILSQRGFDNVYLLSGSMDLYIQLAVNEEYIKEHEPEAEYIYKCKRLQIGE